VVSPGACLQAARFAAARHGRGLQGGRCGHCGVPDYLPRVRAGALVTRDLPGQRDEAARAGRLRRSAVPRPSPAEGPVRAGGRTASGSSWSRRNTGGAGGRSRCSASPTWRGAPGSIVDRADDDSRRCCNRRDTGRSRASRDPRNLYWCGCHRGVGRLRPNRHADAAAARHAYGLLVTCRHARDRARHVDPDALVRHGRLVELAQRHSAHAPLCVDDR